MVRSKPGPKKPQRGVDFKKIKRKIGRKLPPARNHTDTQIKSKAIVLPEQSVASDRTGLAVNKKGLTLRELLQQTSHHNVKIRKAALMGIKDLVVKHPSELKLHRLVVIEKLRERICDSDKNVRDALYQLLENEIFPCFKEDFCGAIITLVMAYVFNAMTHMVLDIRLMAFKFFNLVVQSFPSSFILYAEKVLDNYMDILKNNQIYLQDRSKLKNVLDGLFRCVSSLASRKGENCLADEPNVVERRRLYSFETVIYKDDKGINSVVKKFDDLVPVLVNCFRESISLIRATPAFDAQSFDCMLKTIECINLVVKVFVHESYVPSVGSWLSPTSPFTEPNGSSRMFIHLSKLWESFPVKKMHSSSEKEDERYLILNLKIIEILLHLTDWVEDRTVPIEKFLEFIETSFGTLLPGQGGSHLPFNKVLLERHFGPIILFTPKLVSQITDEWKNRLLEAFTAAYIHCKVDSKLSLAYLSAIEEMIVPVKSDSAMSTTTSYPDMLGYRVAWIQHLPTMLLHLGDKQPSVSKVVLKLILRIGQSSPQNSHIALEYDNLQWSLKEFYNSREAHNGSFLKLPGDCQELAVCSLYYISSLNSDFLQSLASCCLCDDIDPLMLLRIIEVLHSAYKAGHVHISDHIGFLVTLVAQKVFPDKFCIIESNGKASNRRTFKSLSCAVCSCLTQMGDRSLMLKLLTKTIFYEMSKKPSVDNVYGLLCIIVCLDTRPTKLSEEYTNELSNCLFVYLIKAASYLSEQTDGSYQSDNIQILRYYIQPCVYLFNGSARLLLHVMKLFESSIKDNFLEVECVLKPLDRVHLVCSILIFMHTEVKLLKCLSSCKEVIQSILHCIFSLMDSSAYSLTFEEKHSIRTLCDHLKSEACIQHGSDASNLEAV